MLLFPADVLRPRRVDEHYEGEAAAARVLGWPVALIDHDAVAAVHERRAVPSRPRTAWLVPGAGRVHPGVEWTVGADREGFDAARSRLGPGPAVLRDYSKSMKHAWHEATYIPELADADAAWAVARRMLELRGDDLTGGFVLRRFKPFTGPEARS